MTACQTSERGQEKLWTNLVCKRVYSLNLDGGGNIMVNTTELLKQALTQLETTTMGCRFESPMDSRHKGSLTYPPSLLAELEQIGEMETGQKHFRPNEVTTELNGEQRFRNRPDREREEPFTLELNQRTEALGVTRIHGTGNLQGSNLRRRSQDIQSLETKSQVTYPVPKTTTLLVPDTEVEKDKGEDKGELNTRLTCFQDTPCSGFRVDQRPSKQYLCTSGEVKEDSPVESEPTDYTVAIKKDNGTKLSYINQDPFQGHQDIHLLTPEGENVLW